MSFYDVLLDGRIPSGEKSSEICENQLGSDNIYKTKRQVKGAWDR